MNYRHAFHAGNFADVAKHAVLVALLEAMKQKDSPFSYFDSHAGAGRYDLAGEEAKKTGEHREGIARLLAATRLPATLHVYLNLVRSLAPERGGALTAYPGSPLIAALLTRPDDRLVLCEVQDVETESLRRLFLGDKRVAIHRRDGYQALRALLPPTPRRGLALIDPPFESQSLEFDAIADALEGAFARWKTGVYAIWYPIKLAQHVAPFLRFLRQSGMPKILVAELLVHPANSALRLNGCGIAIVNAPYRLDRTLGEILPVLLKHLAQGRFGSQRVEWLVEG
ncbi:MAG TPA: 23S rRNA (adenine(2030)-N(6))-methyltransferase RlmJ [Candidatus Saccharimonadia bacterium]|nr:23S rRNA (adenine(2030)-N(6))-methyltransferase RlmJ [Candidatus Saccharimonadia bacterium]